MFLKQNQLNDGRWQNECDDDQERERLRHLYVIEHREPVFAALRATNVRMTPTKACTALSCKRCTERMGGYQFRWWCWKWAKKYDELRRLGAMRSADISMILSG